jgi:hypothetical protein
MTGKEGWGWVAGGHRWHWFDMWGYSLCRRWVRLDGNPRAQAAMPGPPATFDKACKVCERQLCQQEKRKQA